MKPIIISAIPHYAQRYETVGDYFDTPSASMINVSEMADWRFMFLIAMHELTEWALTRHRGIGEHHITEFDQAFEAKREAGNTDEPGDDPASPYRKEHRFAETLERMLAHELGVDWFEYEAAVLALDLPAETVTTVLEDSPDDQAHQMVCAGCGTAATFDGVVSFVKTCACAGERVVSRSVYDSLVGGISNRVTLCPQP